MLLMLSRWQEGWGCTRIWERTQLTQTDQRNISLDIMLISNTGVIWLGDNFKWTLWASVRWQWAITLWIALIFFSFFPLFFFFSYYSVFIWTHEFSYFYSFNNSLPHPTQGCGSKQTTLWCLASCRVKPQVLTLIFFS